ncbi:MULTISPECIES: phage tail tape measure protein [Rhizobiaceae]|jgi:phage-related minor tail protein|uniref:Phage-related minor tail protein n=1 Tax=Aliirhizobium cellulosilyticum TaxID=393664 RepID=A0A7W6WPM3_9HYPH|nr:phage tail tape measure protein [Rhizobium cellulosilyticum]MBB4348155.1 phage-related minor tail protein [Rhizobium cellulosilyticum]MBB4411392.1 phage-related minor tail protein [Rhizobium cellulosilyticum]MBB4446081.1 phage-related minor tail protein [Rhizobium cellulosilyticum]
MENDDTDVSATLAGAEALSDVMADLEARSQRFGTALTGALRSATTGSKGLEDVLRGLGNRLTDIALSAGLKPLEGLLGNAVGSLIGSVTPFADGGVVRAPSYFPMNGGTGLMGEAGPEAILPLKRGPDGSVGVASAGGGAGPQIVFNVTATDVASFRKSEAQVSAMLARSVMRGRRGL